jgi:hypothetical protein
MGSYTTVKGKITFDKEINRETIDKVLEKLKTFSGFIEYPTKDAKTTFYMKADWKFFDQEGSADYMMELVSAFAAEGYAVDGYILCRHETGDQWQVKFSPGEVVLFEAVVTYKPVRTFRLTEKAVKVVEQSIVWEEDKPKKTRKAATK